MKPPLNIVLFGEAGVGKSSVVNLIADRQIAETSSGVRGCTLSFTPYTFPFNDRKLCVWDTAGLNEPQVGAKEHLDAIAQANKLIKELADKGGVDLLLFCIRGSRITATAQSNYRLFYEVLCGSQVPIALVITHLEWEEILEDWWNREAESLTDYGIKVAGHACVTGLSRNKKYLDARQNIIRLLEGQNGDGRFNMPIEAWFIRFFRRSKPFFSLERSRKQEIVDILMKRCNLDPGIAKELANKLKDSTFNVILFGETGVGKSSVVNLIAQKQIAKVSPSTKCCTLDSTRYEIPIDDMKFAVYDTVGLGEPEFQGVNDYLKSVEKAYKLILQLTASDGIHLLLFCMRGGRVTKTTQNNYRLFSEFLCGEDVPVALVFTHLEEEERMEDWWIKEKEELARAGISEGAGHACITARQGNKDTPEQQLKYTESQTEIRKLLKECVLRGDNISQESSRSWIAKLAGKMQSFLKAPVEQKDMIKQMKKRTDLDPEVVKQIVDMMYAPAAGDK